MDKIIFRDKTLDWFDRIFDGKTMKKSCWILMATMSGYLAWILTR